MRKVTSFGGGRGAQKKAKRTGTRESPVSDFEYDVKVFPKTWGGGGISCQQCQISQFGSMLSPVYYIKSSRFNIDVTL